MGYGLGIDLGTTYTAAAVARDGRAEVVNLGNRSPVIPSIVLVKDAETILVGEAALRRAAVEPGRVAREFKRRIGDPTPILLGGAPYSPEALMARLLRWTVDTVTEREGEPASRVAVTHPANWGPYKLDLLTQAVRLAEVKVDRYLTEPEAAAASYAAAERIAAGTIVAVYDLGGGTFDACVLRKCDDFFEILGEPDGIERLGGVDFDQALLGHVASMLGGAVEALDPLDPASLAALARLREECVQAKEALSSDTDTSVPVMLPGVQTEVLVTRAELETMIRPPLVDTAAAMRRALRSAGLEAAAVDAVLLVGGSSRIPLVAELVRNELGRPVLLDAHPKHVVALGAALSASAPAVSTFVPPSDAEQPSPPGPVAEAPSDVGEPTAAALAAPSSGALPSVAAQSVLPRSVVAVVLQVVLALGVLGLTIALARTAS